MGVSTDWVEGTWQTDEALAAAIKTDWQMVSGMVRHSFTHFHLELTVFRGRSSREREPRGVWCEVEKFGDHALPTVMKKSPATYWRTYGRD